MKKRSKAQEIGSRGQRLVAYLVEKSGCWIARTQDEDFGIDLEVELKGSEVAGQLLKLQVKSSAKVSITHRGVLFKVDRNLVRYADVCRVPVVQVLVDSASEEAWYLWLQEWLLDQRRSGTSLKDLPSTASVYVRESAKLSVGLLDELQDVARWSTKTQLVLAVNDAVRTAAAVHDRDVLNSLVQLLSRIGLVTEGFPIDLVIEQAVALGTRLRATFEGNQVSGTLYAVCRALGRHFTAKQIETMVMREDSYSRAGINALGILYDEYPKHVAALGLPRIFGQRDAEAPAYYCRLRELFLGRSVMEFMFEVLGMKVGDLMFHPDAKDELLSKWPNRGDSVFLDYLVRYEGSRNVASD